jgi:hypothetical protein
MKYAMGVARDIDDDLVLNSLRFHMHTDADASADGGKLVRGFLDGKDTVPSNELWCALINAENSLNRKYKQSESRNQIHHEGKRKSNEDEDMKMKDGLEQRTPSSATESDCVYGQTIRTQEKREEEEGNRWDQEMSPLLSSVYVPMSSVEMVPDTIPDTAVVPNTDIQSCVIKLVENEDQNTSVEKNNTKYFTHSSSKCSNDHGNDYSLDQSIAVNSVEQQQQYKSTVRSSDIHEPDMLTTTLQAQNTSLHRETSPET